MGYLRAQNEAYPKEDQILRHPKKTQNVTLLAELTALSKESKMACPTEAEMG
jgi:hypothetical protein